MLPFGVKTAPAFFLNVMNPRIAGLPGTAACLDDLFVVSQTEDEIESQLTGSWPLIRAPSKRQLNILSLFLIFMDADPVQRSSNWYWRCRLPKCVTATESLWHFSSFSTQCEMASKPSPEEKTKNEIGQPSKIPNQSRILIYWWHNEPKLPTICAAPKYL